MTKILVKEPETSKRAAIAKHFTPLDRLRIRKALDERVEFFHDLGEKDVARELYCLSLTFSITKEEEKEL